MKHSTIRNKTVKAANTLKMPQRLKDKMYMIYSMAIIAEGLSLDTKQTEAHQYLCALRQKTNGVEAHGELADNIETYYQRLKVANIALYPCLLYLIVKEYKKFKEMVLSNYPLSKLTNDIEIKAIEEITKKYFINFDIVRQIEATNIEILNLKQ